MVESELFPCLRYFGLRFYAYNPVSVSLKWHSPLQTPINFLLSFSLYLIMFSLSITNLAEMFLLSSLHSACWWPAHWSVQVLRPGDSAWGKILWCRREVECYVSSASVFFSMCWFSVTLCSYRDRYWRESTFKGMDMVRRALDESYGAGQVSLVSASLRWLNHHSLMKPECGGKEVVNVL